MIGIRPIFMCVPYPSSSHYDLGVAINFNSLAPGRFQRNLRKVSFMLVLVIDGRSISCKFVLTWMPMDLTDDKLTLAQLMAWCRQAPSHYLSQCWPRLPELMLTQISVTIWRHYVINVSPYGVIMSLMSTYLVLTYFKDTFPLLLTCKVILCVSY